MNNKWWKYAGRINHVKTKLFYKKVALKRYGNMRETNAIGIQCCRVTSETC